MCCMLSTFHVSSWIVANISESSLLFSQYRFRPCWGVVNKYLYFFFGRVELWFGQVQMPYHSSEGRVHPKFCFYHCMSWRRWWHHHAINGHSFWSLQLADPCLDQIGSDSGLLPYGTKPLSEPMITYHYWSPQSNSTENTEDIDHLNAIWKSYIWITVTSPKGRWVN